LEDSRPTEILRHGAYLCLQVPDSERRATASMDVEALAQRFSLKNEFESRDRHPNEAIAFLPRIEATASALSDERLLNANALVHIAAPTSGPITQFCEQLVSLLGPTIKVGVLSGVVRPMSYNVKT